MKLGVAIILSILFFSFNAHSQSQATNLNVFLDCNNYGGDCYKDFVRQELSIITFVRDRLDADVHIIAKNNDNSVGVQINTFFLIGRNAFAGKMDTINFSYPMNSTDAEKRKIWVQELKIALMPFIAKTSLINHVSIEVQKKDTTDTATKEKDPYDFWVFQVGMSGSFDGNQIYKSANGNGYLFADRETAISKTNIYVNANEQYSKYNDQGTYYIYEYQQFNVGADYARKMNQHYAIGGGVDFTNSIYSNLKSQYTIGPKIEYSIFPYKEFNTKRWIVQYGIDARNNTYYDTTIYLKTHEFFFAQNLSSIYSLTQKWGSINVGVFWRNLMQDWSKNNLSFNGAVSARLFKGLNFSVWGNYNFVRNQINIRKGDATIDQLLAKNREILSSYGFNLGMGLSYRFGSKFNDAVNPSFKGLNYNINL